MALHGSRSRLLLIAASVSALVAFSPGIAVGAGSASATISESPACSFLVRYMWSGFSGTHNLSAHVQLWRRDPITGDTSIVGGDVVAPNVSGHGGTISHTIADGGQTAAHTYFAQGYLTQKNGNVLKGSLMTSNDVPAVAETCS